LKKLRKVYTWVLLLALIVLPIKTALAQAENLRSGVTTERIRLVVDMDKPYAVKEKALGPRLVVDIPTKVAKIERILVRDPLVRRAYLEPYGNAGRLVVFLMARFLSIKRS